MLIYEMLSIWQSNLSLQWPIPSITSFPRSLAMLDPTQKTTITRFVHILAAVDRSYWGHNSDELAAIDPMSIGQFLPPTATQRAPGHAMPEGHSTLEYPCDLGLGSLHPVVPKEVTADRWNTTSSLVFFINGPISHAGTERTKRGGYLNERRALADNVFRFVSGLQHDQRESVRHHPSRYIPYPFLLLHKYSSTASLSRREPKRRRDGDTGCEHGLWSKSGSNRWAEPPCCRRNSFS